ncbi:MAG TPA: serine hydrolase [Tetragenococcus sp.]|nr:serine hydrolase [Tetragenococcus sp.]
MLKQQIQQFISEQEGNVGVYIKNLKTAEEIRINEEKVFPSASTIKLTIMIEIFQQVKDGKLSLNKKITLTEEMLTDGDGILKELALGHQFTIREIMTLMIILSDNMATNILIDLLSMEAINQNIADMGLKKTRLQRKMMDLKAAEEGRENQITAREAGEIMQMIYAGKCVDQKASEEMLAILKKQQVSGRLDLYLPEEVVIAHKTGDLDCLEHDAGIVYLPENNYIIVVLTNEGKSNKEGREIIGKISKMVYDEFK